MLRLTKEQNEEIDKLLAKKVTQKGHFMTLGDAARLIKEKLGKPEQELEEHQGEQPLETRKQFEDTIFNVGEETEKHGSHDQSTHGGGRGGGSRKRPETKSPEPRAGWKPDFPTTDAERVHSFASKYPGSWHSFSQDKKTRQAVEAVARRGDIEISRETRQFRLKRRKKVAKALTIDEARERSKEQRERRRSGGRSKVTKGKITHTRAYQEVKDKPGVRSPHALAQHIVEEAGGEPKKKVSKRKVMKHPGHPDQRVHSPTGRAAISREQAAAKKPSDKPTGPSSPAPLKVKLRVKLQNAMKDVDAILDTLDRGTRVFRELKEAKEAIQARLKERQEEKKVTKSDVIKFQTVLQNTLAKGITHSLKTLKDTLTFVEAQKPNEPLGEKKEKELESIIAEVSGMVTYFDDVKTQGHFSKKTKDGLSWTTPAVADSIRRQRQRPNPKGRGVQGYNN